MLIRIVRLSIDPAHLQTFHQHFTNSKQKIRAFPGCTHLQLLEDSKQKNILFTYSHWESETHLNKYLTSQLFNTTWAQVKPLFSAKARAWSLQEVTTVNLSDKS